MKQWNALLKHPRPMGRPFMYRWYGPIQAETRQAAMDAAQFEAKFSGYRVAKLVEIKATS